MDNHVKFNTPPLKELAIGIIFDKPLNFQNIHFGLLWQKFAEDYPNTSEMPFMPNPVSINDPLPLISTMSLLNKLPLPRVVFHNKNEMEAIQIQTDSFVFNWKKKDKKNLYPGFKNILKELKDNYNILKNFLSEMKIDIPQIKSGMFTYVNDIPCGEGYGNLADIPNIFLNFSPIFKDKFSLPVSNLMLFQEFLLPENKGKFNLKIGNVRRTQNQNNTSIILEISAIKNYEILRSEDELFGWFSFAHNFANEYFNNATSDKIRTKIWGQIK